MAGQENRIDIGVWYAFVIPHPFGEQIIMGPVHVVQPDDLSYLVISSTGDFTHSVAFKPQDVEVTGHVITPKGYKALYPNLEETIEIYTR